MGVRVEPQSSRPCRPARTLGRRPPPSWSAAAGERRSQRLSSAVLMKNGHARAGPPDSWWARSLPPGGDRDAERAPGTVWLSRWGRVISGGSRSGPRTCRAGRRSPGDTRCYGSRWRPGACDDTGAATAASTDPPDHRRARSLRPGNWIPLCSRMATDRLKNRVRRPARVVRSERGALFAAGRCRPRSAWCTTSRRTFKEFGESHEPLQPVEPCQPRPSRSGPRVRPGARGNRLLRRQLFDRLFCQRGSGRQEGRDRPGRGPEGARRG